MTHLIHVGNSLGVRIPKAIIAQMGVDETTPLSLKITREGLLIAPAKHGREGWAEAFQKAEKESPEPLLMGDFANKFDEEEWEW
jgi:antitoxin MazE